MDWGGGLFTAFLAAKDAGKGKSAWRDTRVDDEPDGEGRLDVPPPGQRHAAGYMEPDESADHLALLKKRQAAGLPPDPRDGGELPEEGEGSADYHRGYEDGEAGRPFQAPSGGRWGA